MRTVGIILFTDVEVLDFAGPFEVFSVTGRRDYTNPFDVFTIAETSHPVAARNNLIITPTHSFERCPRIDILVVPGGYGTRREMLNERLLEFVVSRSASAEIVLSICTGALILGQAGLLDGFPVTTHHLAIDELKKAAPAALVQADRRIIDNGKFVIAAGVSSGIDASFHVVAKLLGNKAAEETAHYIEYPLILKPNSQSYS